jgi:hypothetical protein
MYTSKQQAINHYLVIMTDESNHTLNKVDEVVRVKTDKMIATLNKQTLLKETFDVKLPPAIEVEWDTNDTKEFDRLLHKILFKEHTLH